MSLYPTIREMRKLLLQADGWLDKAVQFAAAKKFDVETLLTARLAPDMFPLARQVQAACDQAKYAAARGAGKDVPSHPDTETSIAELRARIAKVVEFLGTLKAADFAGSDDRTLSLPRWEGKTMTVTDYVTEHATPNFYFHLAMTYALLRHNGVDIGKRDYLGALSFR